MIWTESDGVWTCGPWTIENTRPLAPQELDLRWNGELVDWDRDVDRLKRQADMYERFVEIVRASE